MTTPIEQITAQIAQLDAKLPELQAEFSQLDAQAVTLQLSALSGDADASQRLQASQRARGLAKIQIDDLNAGLKHLVQKLGEAQDVARLAAAREQLPRIEKALGSLPGLEKRLMAALKEIAACETELEALDALGNSVTFTCKHQHKIDLAFSNQGPRARAYLLQGHVANAGCKYIAAPSRTVVRPGSAGTIDAFRASLERLAGDLKAATGGAA